MKYYAIFDSPVGQLLLTANEDALTGLWFDGDNHISSDMTPAYDFPLFKTVQGWLNNYFSGGCPDPMELPLCPAGTNFQKLIWNLLLQIPYGEARNYGTLAKKAAITLGKERMSAQAVGNAVGKNPISIIIPCHRVLGADGSLTGFGGGLDRKKFLLNLENIPYKESRPK